MKKRILLAVTTLVVSASVNISVAATVTPAEQYANQVIEAESLNPGITARVVEDGQAKVDACEALQLQLDSCDFIAEVLAILSGDDEGQPSGDETVTDAASDEEQI